MAMPAWWEERRFGVLIHASPASVPAFAPLGADAAGYRSHLGGDGAPPLVEVLAHHRDRWGHLGGYDDFVPLLDFAAFDAEAWASLVRDAGAGWAVATAKHDGWAWWDAPGTEARLTERGPARDVLGELAAACERHDLVVGAAYPPPADGVPGDETARAEADLVDLVGRMGVALVVGGGAARASSPELADRLAGLEHAPILDDRWSAAGGPAGPVRALDAEPPATAVDGPWMLRRPIGRGAGLNRNERAGDQLSGLEIVDLLSEVVAKGGNLLLEVGAGADGAIPDEQAAPLREAGTWIRRHGAALASTTPWVTWGDADVRYLDAGGALVLVDVTGRGRFAELHPSRWRVTSVEPAPGSGGDGPGPGAPAWHQDDDGLHVTLPPVGPGDPVAVAVLRAGVEPVERAGALFEPGPPAATPLGPRLDGAPPGAIVQLGDGDYVGPASVPDGVTVRGLGPGRTTVTLDGGPATGAVALRLGRGSRLEHVHVRPPTGADAGAAPAPLVVVEGDGATVLGCAVDGAVEVRADDVLVRAVRGRRVVGLDADRLHVSRCVLTGDRGDVAIELRGGGGHRIDSNELTGHGCAVHLASTTGSEVRGNTIVARWCGVHADHVEDAHVHGNRVRATMRAVDVDGGRHVVVDGNSVIDGDSGCVVSDGAAECEVHGNHWDRCRLGLLAWDAVGLRHQGNTVSDPRDEAGALVVG